MQINLLHGFTQTSTSWGSTIVALQEQIPSATFWAPDMPGHGRGSALPITLPEGATTLAAASTPGLWIGYSMGGRYLLHIAVQHPQVVTGLVLVSTTAGLDLESQRNERTAADDALADSIEQDGVPAFLDRWMSLPMFANLRPTAEDLAARKLNSGIGLAESLRQAGTGRQEPLWNRLNEIRVPTLIVTGEQDLKFSALGERLANTIPGSAREVIPQTGHAVHLEQPQRFSKAIADWVLTRFNT
jgi:2-succinyl-6-hydroxy-2,4-cyclohexadiene-1-carboxylate synthase